MKIGEDIMELTSDWKNYRVNKNWRWLKTGMINVYRQKIVQLLEEFS